MSAFSGYLPEYILFSMMRSFLDCDCLTGGSFSSQVDSKRRRANPRKVRSEEACKLPQTGMLMLEKLEDSLMAKDGANGRLKILS